MRTTPQRCGAISAAAVLLAAVASLSAACSKGEKAQRSAAPTASTGAAPAGPADLRRIGASIPEQITGRDADSLLGGERGLDHVGVAVRDLDAARRAYALLGFANPQAGRLPNGLENVNFYFGNATYLELLTAYDKAKAAGVARFLDAEGAGAMFFVLAVFSAEETSRFLAKRGLVTGSPIPGRIETPGTPGDGLPMWHTLFVSAPAFAANPFFFIAYDRAIRNVTLKGIKDDSLRRRAFAHPNKALGITSVWLAVRDLDEARRQYLELGLVASAPVQQAYLGAHGVEMRAGQGSLLLLSPDGPDTRLAQFLGRRAAALVGLAVQVESVAWTQGLLQRRLATTLPAYRGSAGPAVLVPPERAAGTFVEFFERD
jgi:hypothetical protein